MRVLHKGWDILEARLCFPGESEDGGTVGRDEGLSWKDWKMEFMVDVLVHGFGGDMAVLQLKYDIVLMIAWS